MKKISILCSLLFICLIAQAQNKISSYMISIPDDFLLALTPDQKAQLVSVDSTTVTLINGINEKVERVGFSDDYIAIKTSEAGLLQVKLLPLVNNTDILGVITTVCGPACDSRIDFYTTSWIPLSQSDLFPQRDKNWFLDDNANVSSQDFQNSIAVLDFTPVKLSFSADNKDVIAGYDIENYLSVDDYKLLQPFLKKKSKTFRWDKLSYKE